MPEPQLLWLVSVRFYHRIFGDLQTSKTCPQRILLSLSGYNRSFFGCYQRKFRVSGFCFYRGILGLAVIRFRGFLHCTA